jgi:hypothetical protein
MGRNLLRVGFALTVHDVDRSAVDALVAEGATAGTTPGQVAAATDVLMTMLPDSPQVREVYLGPDGAFEALRPGWLAIDMSSIAPSTARDLAARATAGGAEILDFRLCRPGLSSPSTPPPSGRPGLRLPGASTPTPSRFTDWLEARGLPATTDSLDLVTLADYVADLRSRPKVSGGLAGSTRCARALIYRWS